MTTLPLPVCPFLWRSSATHRFHETHATRALGQNCSTGEMLPILCPVQTSSDVAPQVPGCRCGAFSVDVSWLYHMPSNCFQPFPTASNHPNQPPPPTPVRRGQRDLQLVPDGLDGHQLHRPLPPVSRRHTVRRARRLHGGHRGVPMHPAQRGPRQSSLGALGVPDSFVPCMVSVFVAVCILHFFLLGLPTIHPDTSTSHAQTHTRPHRHTVSHSFTRTHTHTDRRTRVCTHTVSSVWQDYVGVFTPCYILSTARGGGQAGGPSHPRGPEKLQWHSGSDQRACHSDSSPVFFFYFR